MVLTFISLTRQKRATGFELIIFLERSFKISIYRNNCLASDLCNNCDQYIFQLICFLTCNIFQVYFSLTLITVERFLIVLFCDNYSVSLRLLTWSEKLSINCTSVLTLNE